MISYKTGFAKQNIKKQLTELEHQDLITYANFKHDINVEFLVPKENDRSINPHKKSIEALAKSKIKQIEAVIALITSQNKCIQNQILNYFGEQSTLQCGHCHHCLKEKKKTPHLETLILSYLQKVDSASFPELLENFEDKEEAILKSLRRLLKYEKITRTAQNKYKIK